MNKKEFYRNMQLFNLNGHKIHVCWRIYCALVERRESRITDQISKANLMKLAKITNWQLMMNRVTDLVNAGIITDTWEIVE